MNLPSIISLRRTFSAVLVASLMLFSLVTVARALCPADGATPFTAGPVNPQNGFALYVQDAEGLALEMCLNSIDGQGTPPNCFFDPPQAGNLFSQQIGFGAEGFWWAADASIDVPATGLSAVLVQAVEAAVLTEVAVDGEQFPFTRLRIRVDVPQPGIYTVTHPYGQQEYIIESVGAGFEIRESFDIEFAPGLQGQGRVGPFLRWDNTPPAAPAGYVGDALTPHSVVGSPCGTNYFQVEGKTLAGAPINLDGAGGNVVSTDQFIVMGKLYTGVAPAPLVVNRTTYGRDINGQVNIFAHSASTASLTFSGGANLPPGQHPLASDGNGTFFGHLSLGDAGILPGFVDVTANNPGNGTTVHKSRLVDKVSITRAEYDMTNGVLSVEATSSDIAGAPTLTVAGLGPVPLNLAVPAPPASVSVSSSAGGTDVEAVSIIAGAVAGNLPPTAVDDAATTLEGTAVTIDLLANDSDPNDPAGTLPPGSIDIASLAVGTAPQHGSLLLNGDGTATYTPDPFYNGADQFTYTVRDTFGAFSNVATVSITVQGVNNPPQAVNDLASLNIGTLLDIPVLANDIDPDNNLDPASIVIVTAPLLGTAIPRLDGTVRYQAGVTSGTDSFVYTVADANGALSNPAVVTITVTNVLNETISVQKAQFKGGKNEWKIDGSTTVPGPGNTISVYLGPDTTGQLVGTADVDALGAWRFKAVNSPVAAGGTTQITVRSTSGATTTAPLQVQ